MSDRLIASIYHPPIKGLIAVKWKAAHVIPGAIIGDGDHKRAPFLVLGLSPRYGTIFLFLAQIAPSPAAHTRTCCEDFCGYLAGKMASESPQIYRVFGPQLNAFRSAWILRKSFRRKLLQFEWSKTVSNLGMFRLKLIYIADQVVLRCFFYMSCTLLHFKFYMCWRLTAFPWHRKKLAGCI